MVLDKNGEGGWEPDEDGTTDGPHDGANAIGGAAVVRGVTGEGLRVVKDLDLAVVRSSLQAVLDRGITSLAVMFLHR